MASRDNIPSPALAVAESEVVAIGVPAADPLIGLAITALILRITWQAWRTVSSDNQHD